MRLRNAPTYTPTGADGRLQARLAARQELVRVTEGLLTEFEGALPPGVVIRQVARAREQLLAAGVRAGLATAVEVMARTRLRGVVGLRPVAG